MTLLGLLAVTFVIGRVIPIDPVLAIIGERATAEQYAAAREALGLNRPLWVQFAIYVRDAATGDLGKSLLTGQPVIEDVKRVFPATLELATLATLLGVALGVPAGVLAATRPGTLSDQWCGSWASSATRCRSSGSGSSGSSSSTASWTGCGGPGRLDTSYEFMFDLDVPRVTGSILIDSALAGAWDIFANALSHIVLPAAVLGYYSMAYISRMTRSFMLDQLEPGIRHHGPGEGHARAAGRLGACAAQHRRAADHRDRALLRLPARGLGLTETVFAWPGLGLYITNALFSADMAAVLGGTIVVGAAFVLLNMVSDVLYRFSIRGRAGEGAGMSAALRATWLARREPGARGGRRGSASSTAAGSASRTTRSALARPRHRRRARPHGDRGAADRHPRPDRAEPRRAAAAAAHARRTGSAPTSSAATSASRVVYGARITLYIVAPRRRDRARLRPRSSAPSPAISAAGSTRVLMRITDIFLAFPRLILALAFVAALGPGIDNAIIAIALTAWPPYARLARAETLTVRKSDYIAAVRLQGASAPRILFRHIVPMCLPSVIVRVTLDMAGIILTAAGLGFLGLGAQPPLPEWGAMISSGRKFLFDQWWVATVPGLAIFIVCLGFNLLGDGLRDVLDPRRPSERRAPARGRGPARHLPDRDRAASRRCAASPSRSAASGSASSASRGSGKSMTGRALLGLLPPRGRGRREAHGLRRHRPPRRVRPRGCARCAAAASPW